MSGSLSSAEYDYESSQKSTRSGSSCECSASAKAKNRIRPSVLRGLFADIALSSDTWAHRSSRTDQTHSRYLLSSRSARFQGAWFQNLQISTDIAMQGLSR